MIHGPELRVHFLKSFQKGSTCENLSQKGLKTKKDGKCCSLLPNGKDSASVTEADQQRQDRSHARNQRSSLACKRIYVVDRVKKGETSM
jgi:hypothetical protein